MNCLFKQRSRNVYLDTMILASFLMKAFPFITFEDFVDSVMSDQIFLSDSKDDRVANSVRRAISYIENVLDNKFIPDSSHGINHIKHNLEYGYSLMNLIELPRRRVRYGP